LFHQFDKDQLFGAHVCELERAGCDLRTTKFRNRAWK
jgi:hypothetical protein